MKGGRFLLRASIMNRRHLTIAGLVLAMIVATLAIGGCTKTEPVQAPAVSPPVTTPAPAAIEIGMKPGERYHEIHTGKLQLKCNFCHINTPQTFNDPLAQVSNQVDKRACLSCHKEGSEKPFYGESWTEAKVLK